MPQSGWCVVVPEPRRSFQSGEHSSRGPSSDFGRNDATDFRADQLARVTQAWGAGWYLLPQRIERRDLAGEIVDPFNAALHDHRTPALAAVLDFGDDQADARIFLQHIELVSGGAGK